VHQRLEVRDPAELAHARIRLRLGDAEAMHLGHCFVVRKNLVIDVIDAEKNARQYRDGDSVPGGPGPAVGRGGLQRDGCCHAGSEYHSDHRLLTLPAR
jgi:hypothetical protein